MFFWPKSENDLNHEINHNNVYKKGILVERRALCLDAKAELTVTGANSFSSCSGRATSPRGVNGTVFRSSPRKQQSKKDGKIITGPWDPFYVMLRTVPHPLDSPPCVQVLFHCFPPFPCSHRFPTDQPAKMHGRILSNLSSRVKMALSQDPNKQRRSSGGMSQSQVKVTRHQASLQSGWDKLSQHVMLLEKGKQTTRKAAVLVNPPGGSLERRSPFVFRRFESAASLSYLNYATHRYPICFRLELAISVVDPVPKLPKWSDVCQTRQTCDAISLFPSGVDCPSGASAVIVAILILWQYGLRQR